MTTKKKKFTPMGRPKGDEKTLHGLTFRNEWFSKVRKRATAEGLPINEYIEKMIK